MRKIMCYFLRRLNYYHRDRAEISAEEFFVIGLYLPANQDSEIVGKTTRFPSKRRGSCEIKRRQDVSTSGGKEREKSADVVSVETRRSAVAQGSFA